MFLENKLIAALVTAELKTPAHKAGVFAFGRLPYLG